MGKVVQSWDFTFVCFFENKDRRAKKQKRHDLSESERILTAVHLISY